MVADILLRSRDAGENIVPIGFLDDNPECVGRRLLDLPILGAVADLTRIEHDLLVVAVGDNKLRAKIFESVNREARRFTVARHPSAVLAPDAKIGEGSMICAAAIVCTGAVIGRNVILNTSCTVDHHNNIGDHAHLAVGVHLGGEAEVGEGTLIGIGATVLPQRRVGRWSIVGAGAVVIEDVPDGVVAVGVPARVIRRV